MGVGWKYVWQILSSMISWLTKKDASITSSKGEKEACVEANYVHLSNGETTADWNWRSFIQ